MLKMRVRYLECSLLHPTSHSSAFVYVISLSESQFLVYKVKGNKTDRELS